MAKLIVWKLKAVTVKVGADGGPAHMHHNSLSHLAICSQEGGPSGGCRGGTPAQHD